MSQKWVSRLVWGLSVIVSAAALVSLAFWMANREPGQNTVRLAEEATWPLVLVAFTLLGALILSRQPSNLVGWLLMVPGALGVLSWPAESYLHSLATSQPPASLPLLLAAWFTTWHWVVLIFPLLLIPLVFPTGRPPSPRWRWVFRASIGLGLFFILLVTFSRILRPLESADWEILNPIGFIPESGFNFIQLPWVLALGSLTLTCLASLFVSTGPVPWNDSRSSGYFTPLGCLSLFISPALLSAIWKGSSSISGGCCCP